MKDITASETGNGKDIRSSIVACDLHVSFDTVKRWLLLSISYADGFTSELKNSRIGPEPVDNRLKIDYKGLRTLRSHIKCTGQQYPGKKGV
ncbi:MAG: hypothetical protein AB2L14_11075 [Candidatus Xenobiia bacterium LiM19]